MPSNQPSLRTDDAVRFIEQQSFPAASPARSAATAAANAAARAGASPHGATSPVLCGLEIEWLTTPLGMPDEHLPEDTALALAEIAGCLPAGSKVTLEPGGQIELSSPPGTLDQVCLALEADAAVARARLTEAGADMLSVGLDPVRPERRILQEPRYVAMEQFFDRGGPDGRSMMCASASVQVNLDLGPPREHKHRWRTANLLGPVLGAAFANSPFRRGAPSGWRSSRAAVWRGLDLSRTSPVPLNDERTENAPNAWARYALNAQVMLVREPNGAFLPGLDHLTFGAWMARGHQLGFPDIDDLGYHLTTLFPPVRPRGWLELRFIDALPEPWWRVPLLVAAALVCDPEASDTAQRVSVPAANLWVESARHGLDHPVLQQTAAQCFAAAQEALTRIGADSVARDTVAAYADRYVQRGRCPADDLLDAWAATGSCYAGVDPHPGAGPRQPAGPSDQAGSLPAHESRERVWTA